MKEFPRIEEDLIKALLDVYEITDSHLKSSEWDRAFLCGQRDVIQKLRHEFEKQKRKNSKSQQIRRA